MYKKKLSVLLLGISILSFAHSNTYAINRYNLFINSTKIILGAHLSAVAILNGSLFSKIVMGKNSNIKRDWPLAFYTLGGCIICAGFAHALLKDFFEAS